jgi:RNA polymerase sigma factor (sigma-70 family)
VGAGPARPPDGRGPARPGRGVRAVLAHGLRPGGAAVDLLRRAEVRDRYATRASTAHDPASPPNPEETAIAAVAAKRVRVAVEELPASQRTAVLLAYFEGRTFRQVARLTAVPEGTAKSRLRLGLRRIADRLESEGLDGEW